MEIKILSRLVSQILIETKFLYTGSLLIDGFLDFLKLELELQTYKQ